MKMRNILENKFWWAARSFAAVIVFGFSIVLSQASGLFISEYSEGGSGFGNEKYLEIYNPTTEDIDLSNYAYANTTNAPTTVGEYEFWNNFPDGAVIASGDVYVIAHPDAAADISVHADETNQYLSNGDDGYCIVEGVESSFTIVDCIGDIIGGVCSALIGG